MPLRRVMLILLSVACVNDEREQWQGNYNAFLSAYNVSSICERGEN